MSKNKIEQLELQLKEAKATIESITKMGTTTPETINLKTDTASEAVAVMCASDWHIEELVKSQSVNGTNRYDLKVAKQRSEEFFVNGVKLLKKEQKDCNISTLILHLGGDFITGNIHEENVETAQLQPADAVLYACKLIQNGIQYLLDNTQVSIEIVCNYGNHSRTTKAQRNSTERTHSLEFFMYKMLENTFKHDRINFHIPEGYMCFVKVFKSTICFHHGHQVNYQGGVGGIYIPMKKWCQRVSQVRRVDLFVNGHFHTYAQDTVFVSNGSMIGNTPYGYNKGFNEMPCQTFFLWDKKRARRTVTIPITFSV